MLFDRQLTRRDFIKLSAGATAALGLMLYNFPNFEEVLAQAVAEVPVLWIQGGNCTGCAVSALNSLSPKIQDVLVNQVVPGYHVSLRFLPTVMAGQGDPAIAVLEDTATKHKGGFVLVVEGAISTKDGGVYCRVGERQGQGIPIKDHLTELAPDAMAVIALGSCTAFGGIPGAAPNPTGCKGVRDVLNDEGIKTPVINIPGCPPHPDWFIGTIASVLIGGLSSVELDKEGRPKAFFGEIIHENCPRRGHYDAGRFAKKLGEEHCLYDLGCKGPVTHADCPVRLWNGGTNWCVGANAPCIGCCEPGFPDDLQPIYGKVSGLRIAGINNVAEKVGIGLAAVTAAGIGGHLILSKGGNRLGKKDEDEETKAEKH